MIKTIADHDITYDLASEDKDWRHRLMLRQRAVVQTAAQDLQTHMNQLGLNYIEAYQDWCGRQGFSPFLGKSRKQMKREQAHHTLLCEQEKYIYDPSQETASAIRRVYDGQLNASDPPFLHKIHHAFANAPDVDSREKLLRYLCHIDQYVDLSYDGVMIPKLNEIMFIDGLIALAHHHSDFIRPVEAWQTTVENPRDMVATFARHLLAPMGAPRFMDAAWFRSDP